MRQVREALIPILQPPAALPPQNDDQPDPPQDLLPIFELTYADDMNIATDDRDVAVTIIEVADPIFEENDLFLNQDKLDIIDLNSKAHVINAQEPLFKGTKNFKMLGTYIDPERDIGNRILQAGCAFRKMSKLWFRHHLVTLKTRLKIYNACIPPILCYNLHTAGLTQSLLDRHDAFHRRQLRWILQRPKDQRLTTKDLYYITESAPISCILLTRRYDLLGHILRREADVPANVAMRNYFDRQPGQAQAPGHPKTTLPSVINKEFLTSFKDAAAERAFITQGDLDVLRTKAAFHPTTAIDNWKEVRDTVFAKSAAAYKNRQTRSSIIRTSARARALLDSS